MKRILSRIFVVLGILILLVISSGGIYIATSIPSLPPGTDETMKQSLM